MTRSRSLLSAAALLAATCLPLSSCGLEEVGDQPDEIDLPEQGPRPSQAASVSQDIHTTTVSVHYFRPVARGREALFGQVVPFGETWTPGANRATYIELTGDVLVNGTLLEAGRYSIWVTPTEESPWPLVFSTEWDMFHQPYPEGTEALVLDVSPEAGDHMESLAVYFPAVEGYQATLRIHWGDTVLPLNLEVPHS
jgi:hypothetical protein